MSVAGFTSTGSKRPDLLFGAADGGLPQRMVRSSGARVTADDGRVYLDFVMGLGAVALGYGHPAVARAAVAAVEAGAVGSLAPVLEDEVARRLAGLMPWLEQVRFLKSGAEAAAAAVRLARVHTGRELVLGCGYHGWLDWCSRAAGVPEGVRALYDELRFNDVAGGRELIRRVGTGLAAVIVEPVIDGPPDFEWLAMLRAESRRAGAVLIYDEIKTACRVALGGAGERWGVVPDLVVLGKAIANGFPLAAVGGSAQVMDRVDRTWISSTLATEFVALAAAEATLETMAAERVPERLDRLGRRLYEGLARLAERFPQWIEAVRGMPVMCHLQFRTEQASARCAAGAARHQLLFKRSAYNFVSLAHQESDVDQCLAILDAVLGEMEAC